MLDRDSKTRCSRFRFAPLNQQQIVPRLQEIAAAEGDSKTRCTRFRFAPLNQQQIVPRLQEIAAAEG
ncbi:unnamed protein product [Plutella xylostella]|uniref:(diamondback moth) hypothetical protein n=1 Tax=Plutella xylostella TaxID=51655 RepID=A0A8S4DPQ7_PLUXY|nr:unnamed protein product [Plutella xylostella]